MPPMMRGGQLSSVYDDLTGCLFPTGAPWRAPSSPRHARGLNVSLFLQPCTWARSAPLLGLYGGWQA